MGDTRVGQAKTSMSYNAWKNFEYDPVKMVIYHLGKKRQKEKGCHRRG